MTTPLRLLCSAIAIFSGITLHAQPMEGNLYRYGCHYSKNKIPFEPLSEAERGAVCGSNARSDSIDILNYAIQLNLTNFSQQIIRASCEITFTAKQNGIEALPLDLLALTVDSITWQGTLLNYDYNGLLLDVHLPQPVNVHDTMEVVIHYQGKPTPDNYWGGFKFENNIAYNLGIGLTSNPYNMGRSWHPCFDNFVERATYDIGIVTNEGRRGYAIGEFLGELDLGGGETLRQYRMPLPLPTYLVGVAASHYEEVHDIHIGANGDYPILLVGKAPDTADMKAAFVYLGDAVDMLESWFGPYIWGQVGYVLTGQGAMEHASLIAYPVSSVGNGPTFGMNRLMTHELAHHWWGNTTTLSCPENMWIKEGNAEYSAHMLFEYLYGKEAFDDIVKDNHYNDVLKNAHIDDEGYWPLSGIPYEWTYGLTTYNKGASVMHNLRGYLGDSLFQQGMRSILETYKFESVDAEQFRDQLTSNTGVDMTSFFDDWIYSPGFAMFELDSVSLFCVDSIGCSATVYVQQKLHKTPHFHTNVPLEITFYDKNWNTHTATFMASGEYSQATVTVPFEPVWQILNDNNRLNLARMQDRKVVKATGNMSHSYCELVNPIAVNVPDSALVSFIHYWGGADPAGPDQPDIELSGTHYWRYGGILPPGFKARVTLSYDGSTENNFDYDLAHTGEDSLILAWRPKPGIPWGEFPFYKKLPFTANDGKGFMRIDTLLPGDYAFAKGSLPLATAVEMRQAQQPDLKVFPNPTSASFTVQGELTSNDPVMVSLSDALGRLVRQEKVQVSGGLLSHRMEVAGLPPGIYWVKVDGNGGAFRFFEKLIKS